MWLGRKEHRWVDPAWKQPTLFLGSALKTLPRTTLRMNEQRKSYVSIPETGHTTGGSCRGARRGDRAWSGTTVRQQNCAPRKQSCLAFSKASRTRRLNVAPEAQTSEILCNATAEQNPRLNRGSSLVYFRYITRTRSILCSWLLDWNVAFLSL